MVPFKLTLSALSVGLGGAGLLLSAALMMLPSGARAEAIADAAPSSRPGSATAGPPRLELPPIRAQVEPGDATTALHAIEVALTQAGDGATYLWQRGNGRLAGAIRVRSTFRDVEGRICRHLEMQMRLGTYVRSTEGIACRGIDGVWLLEG